MTNTNEQHKCKHAKGLFRSADLICFYTGIKLRTNKDDVNSLKASVEHLVPVSSKRQGDHRINKNRVPCANGVNGMIGNAPLSVKYALKEFFKTFTIHPALNDRDLAEAIRNATSIFLSEYKLYGQYVWAWKAYQGKKNVSDSKVLSRRRKLYKLYKGLLTSEEIAVGAYLNWDLKEKA